MRMSLIAAALLFAAAAGTTSAESLVSVGSPTTPFPLSKQNEPSMAIDPAHPSILVAGANEEIDIAPCSGSDCSFTPGVGLVVQQRSSTIAGQSHRLHSLRYPAAYEERKCDQGPKLL
jgi:hypothetical protein